VGPASVQRICFDESIGPALRLAEAVVIRHTRPPADVLRRILENAALLAFASLLVMSVMAGRYAGALLWSGALIVFFTHAWESRSSLDLAERRLHASRSQRYDGLRWIGLALAVIGAAALTS
jgi:hypothetical protein